MSPRRHREDVAVPSRRRLPAETPQGLREAFTEQSRRPFETSLAECLREGFVKPSRCLHEAFTQWARRGASAKGSRRLHERFMKTSRALKASRSLREGFAKASRRRHGRLHLETIRQIMTSPPLSSALLRVARVLYIVFAPCIRFFILWVPCVSLHSTYLFWHSFLC